MATQTPPQSASRRYATSALLAQQAAAKAAQVRPRGALAVAQVVRSFQTAQAVLAERSVAEMLLEQEIQATADAKLTSTAFTTDANALQAMVDTTSVDAEFNRLVESLVQDAGRAAESVSVAVRQDIYHVRFVSLPCCARCAVLAGRVYRWSDGFERHPNCDCSMIPTTVASPLRQNPNDLFEQGQIRSSRRDKRTGELVSTPGLSQADAQAISDGADLSRVVNVRSKASGLMLSGRVLSRSSRPTPEGIYRLANGDRAKAVSLLADHGYIH